jgi:2-dehydro-3-deoxyphosphogluconate aldolase/(4S)-4-hydroxy-2-oxoglutarate aldolase
MAMPILKLEVIGRIVETGLVAVVRAETADRASRIADACTEGGVRALEITFTIAGAARVIEEQRERHRSDGIVIGAGTVLDQQTARIAILAGAQFIVSPALNPDTARLCNRYQIPYMPGASTVREVIEAMEWGAEIVKVFPGETLGPGFVQAVRAALPQAAFMPTGGVSLENVATWIRAGCIAVGVGNQLTGSANIAENANRFIEEIRRARS